LDSICDDDENVDQIILRHAAKLGAECGLTIERPEVVDALKGLVEDGLAKARAKGEKVEGMPSVDVVEEDFETYFYITKKGMELQLSDDVDWPFDDDNNLRPGWHLDDAQS
jgi:hypothetical protein